MIKDDRGKYYLNSDEVRKFAGRTIKEIYREGDSIFIELTDGTGIEVSNDRPTDMRLMIYHWRKKEN